MVTSPESMAAPIAIAKRAITILDFRLIREAVIILINILLFFSSISHVILPQAQA